MDPSTPIWRIELFGSLRIFRDGAQVELPVLLKSRALLAYLAASTGKSISREQLIDLLWPDEDPDSGRQKLRRSLYDLRNQMGDAIVVDRQAATLSTQFVQVDIVEFDTLISQASIANSSAQKQELLTAAIDLYTGEPFSGFFDPGLLDHQRSLADRFSIALMESARLNASMGDLDAAIRFTRRAINVDPLLEENYTTLMQYYAQQGRPTDVARVYRELETRLQNELGEVPTDSVRNLMKQLREKAQSNANSDTAQIPEKSAAQSLGNSSPIPTNRQPKWQTHRTLFAVVGCLIIAAALWRGSAGRSVSNAGGATAALVNSKPVKQEANWISQYEPDRDEKDSEPTAMVIDSSGCTCVTGFVDTIKNDVDFLTLKYDQIGRLLWKRTYNGTGNDVDRARAIAVDLSGNVYVTGESDNGKGNGKSRLSGLDIVTIKYAPDGREIWTRRWNGATNGEDRPAAMKIDHEGSLIIAGVTGALHPEKTGPAPHFAPIVLKYSSDGVLKWQSTESESRSNEAAYYDVAVDGRGCVYAVGTTKTAQFGVRNDDIRIVKYASNGEKLWEKSEASPHNGDDIGRKIAVDRAGNVVIAGHLDMGDALPGGTGKDFFAAGYDTDGNRKWRNVIDTTNQEDFAESIAMDPSGNAVAIGTSVTGHKQDFFVVKFAPDGKELWRKTHNGRGNFDDNAYAVAIDKVGRIAVTGRIHNGSSGGINTDWDFLTVLYQPTGEIVWFAEYDGEKGPDRATCVAFDPTGNVIVTGQAHFRSQGSKIVIIKYLK